MCIGMLDLRPKQILGPPLNGRKPHPGLSPSHRSGLNSSTSGPNISSRRCKAHTEYRTVVPLLTNIRSWPSGPPPTGSQVSLTAWRPLIGTVGYRRSANRPRYQQDVDLLWKTERSNWLGCCVPSFRHQSRYVAFFIVSWVGSSSPKCVATSALNML